MIDLDGIDKDGHYTKSIPVVSIDKAFYRPAEVECLISNPNKIKNELGWNPQISFDVLVKRMVDNDLQNKI